jgi:hypothetical protein
MWPVFHTRQFDSSAFEELALEHRADAGRELRDGVDAPLGLRAPGSRLPDGGSRLRAFGFGFFEGEIEEGGHRLSRSCSE